MKMLIANTGQKNTVLAACLLALLTLPQLAHGEENAYFKVLPSTTWVLSKTSDGTSSGTGVLIDAQKKLVVTNAHVVGDARNAVLFFPELEAGRPIVSRQHYLDNVRRLGIRGSVIAVDRKRDLALVQLEKLPESAQAVELAAESISPSEIAHSIGNPGSTEALWVYSSGTVRAVYRKQFRTGAGEHDFKVVETQSPINSGDSGGPVVNRQGQLVAVAQAIAPNARLVSYCIDISEVRAFLASPWKVAPLPVTEILKQAELAYKQHETGHFEIELSSEGDQKQPVFITKDTEYYERADVRKIWSLAQTSREAPTLEMTMKLLQQNARTKIGSWMVEQTAGGDYLLIYCVKMDATATPDAVKSTMQYVAKLTAAMKKELTPKTEAQSASDTLNAWLAN